MISRANRKASGRSDTSNQVPVIKGQSFGTNQWDIPFLAFDPARAQEVRFFAS